MRISEYKVFILALVCLGQSLVALGQGPEWSVNPAAYQHNMILVAQVSLDFEKQHGLNNVLAAFVNDEIRGVSEPVIVNEEAYYFMTIYSNIGSGEVVEFKSYLGSQDSIFTSPVTIKYRSGTVYGAPDNPLDIHFFTTSDYPISIQPDLADTTLIGFDFNSIALDELLLTFDNDPVEWTIDSTEHIDGVIENGILNFVVNDPLWLGTETLHLIVKELNTTLGHSDTILISLTVIEEYFGPNFNYIPPQFKNGDGTYDTRDLNQDVNHAGACLSFDYTVIPKNGEAVDPLWSSPALSNTMTLYIDINFGGKPFDGDIQIAGMVNGQIAGVVSQAINGTSTIYALELSDIESGAVDIHIYDGAREYIYISNSVIPFIANATIGSEETPYYMDFAPLQIDIDSDGEWSVTETNTEFEDHLLVSFRAIDCDYPSKRDSVLVLFLNNPCDPITMELCAGEVICAKADVDLQNVIWFRNHEAVYNGMEYAILTPGEYLYQGQNTNGSTVLSCPIIITSASNCSDDFPDPHMPISTLELAEITETIEFLPVTTEYQPFENTWSGNGDQISWNDNLNWSTLEEPSACQHVIIPENQHVQIEQYYATKIYSLETRPGASLIIGAGGILRVVGK